MASATGAELQNRQLLGFCEVPSISAVPEARNPGNPQGIWKWLPQKKRTLQNRQLLGFFEVPSISAVLKAAQGGLYKIDNFWAIVKFPPFWRSQRPEISPPIELEISAPAACIFHHATCRHFQRCEPTDITGRNLPMTPIPLSLDAHQCVLVACAWRVENAKRRQVLTVSWRTPPRSSCDICQPEWRTSRGAFIV